MTTQGIIHIENLTKDFGTVRAVNNLCLDIKQGTTVGFLGPNGAGKTTTIKILTNLIHATSGKAFMLGIDVTKEPRDALTNVGAVVETPEFYPFLTPVETLAYLGKIRGMHHDEIEKRTAELLKTVKLTEWKDQRIGKFSKGMKQRLAIAQAMLHEPEILILDEPTSGLDPKGGAEFLEIVEALRNEGKAILMSSHDIFRAKMIADRIGIMRSGKILVELDRKQIAEQDLEKMYIDYMEGVEAGATSAEV